MTGRGSNWNSNLNLAAFPKDLKFCKLCGVWILFRSMENAIIQDNIDLISTLISQTDHFGLYREKCVAKTFRLFGGLGSWNWNISVANTIAVCSSVL